jgi:hypothetical protein
MKYLENEAICFRAANVEIYQTHAPITFVKTSRIDATGSVIIDSAASVKVDHDLRGMAHKYFFVGVSPMKLYMLFLLCNSFPLPSSLFFVFLFLSCESVHVLQNKL